MFLCCAEYALDAKRLQLGAICVCFFHMRINRICIHRKQTHKHTLTHILMVSSLLMCFVQVHMCSVSVRAAEYVIHSVCRYIHT